MSFLPLPSQPDGVPWPTEAWPIAPSAQQANLPAAEKLLLQPPELGLTLALVVVRHGRIVWEGYGPSTDLAEPLISWSMGKSVTQALIGLCVADGLVHLDEPAPVPEWQAPGDGRSAITVRHLLTMSGGLRFNEDYVDAETSHCIEMLFGAGHGDVASYAASLPLDHEPGTVWNYSSGTTNVLARIASAAIGGGEAGLRRYLADRLFGPIGMRSADPRFDAAGTFIGSSFLYATARDFARFGTLYLRNGRWDGRQVLPVGWVDQARTPTPTPPEEEHGYGAQWWLWNGPLGELGTFGAHGYEGQYTLVIPALDAVVVRLGKSPSELRPALVSTLVELVEQLGS